LRPRRDERLEDFPAIRLLDRARLGVSGDLAPHMLPAGLQLDRTREGGAAQRYLIDRNGKITEMPALPRFPDAAREGLPGADSLFLLYRRVPAGSSFAWDAPLRGGERAWAIDRAGRAWALDSAQGAVPVALPEGALPDLEALLGPMAGDPPALEDTAALPAGRPLAYAWFGGRGRLGDAETDTVLAGLARWMGEAGLAGAPAFALPDAQPFRYLAFRADSAGLRYTGDTLILARDPDAPGRYRESLSPGSPGRAADSAEWAYGLRIEGDSLILEADRPFTSRLFGNLEKRTAVFALAGLEPMDPALQFGLPTPTDGAGRTGLWPGDHRAGGRVLVSPAAKLHAADPRARGDRDAGWLFTAAGGLELRWSFPANHAWAEGWDKE
jgi:hypothetical protein